MLHKPKVSKYLLMCLGALSFISFMHVNANDTTQEGYLEGIGYREQALQTAKGSQFATENESGVSLASFGGGTNIYIKGVGLAEDP
jgi:hypothetical protein